MGKLGFASSVGWNWRKDLQDQLNRDIASVVATPEYRAMIERAGSLPVASTSAELAQVIAQTFDDVAATIQEFGLQQEQ